MKAFVLSANENENYNKVKLETGEIAFVDLIVSGSLPDKYKRPSDLVGKTVEYEWDHPFLILAENVKILKEQS